KELCLTERLDTRFILQGPVLRDMHIQAFCSGPDPNPVPLQRLFYPDGLKLEPPEPEQLHLYRLPQPPQLFQSIDSIFAVTFSAPDRKVIKGLVKYLVRDAFFLIFIICLRRKAQVKGKRPGIAFFFSFPTLQKALDILIKKFSFPDILFP